MNQNVQLLMMKGIIAGLPPEDQAQIDLLAAQLRTFLEVNGSNGVTALALVALEISSK